MKYRLISRQIALFYLVESTIVLGILTTLGAGILSELLSKTKAFPLFVLFIFFAAVVYSSYYCVIEDSKLLKATERERNPGSALEYCKSWLALTKFSFCFRIIMLIATLLVEFLYNYFPDLIDDSAFYKIFFRTFQLSLLFLFPGISFLMIYIDQFWPYYGSFSLCRLGAIGTMFILVLLRGFTLYFVLKYQRRLKIAVSQTTSPQSQSTGLMESVIPCFSSRERRTSCVPLVSAEATIHCIPTIVNEANEMILRAASIENQELINTTDDLPRYEDVTNQNPPTYEEIFNLKK